MMVYQMMIVIFYCDCDDCDSDHLQVWQAAQGRQEAGDSEILVAERAGEENKNRSQHIVQQANDGSVGASGSVASVIKRKEKSKNQEDFDSKLMVRGEVPSI